MTIQEAYNKGLDDAENLAVVKFSNALIGNDDGPFNNPQMEEIRQKILTSKSSDNSSDIQIKRNIDDYTLKILLDRPVNDMSFNSLDRKIIEILEFIKSVDRSRLSNRFAVKIKSLLTDLRVDFIKNYDKFE